MEVPPLPSGSQRDQKLIKRRYFGKFSQREERETENRGRKVLDETIKEMAEHTQSTEEASGASELLLAE